MPATLDASIRQRLLEASRIITATFAAGDWRELSLLTNCYEIVDQHPRLLRSLSFGDEDYHGNVIEILQRIGESDAANVEIIERYISRSGLNISSRPAAEHIVFSPSVFNIPTESVDRSLVSVMMPFEAGFREVYTSIHTKLTSQGIGCLRADDIWIDSVIMQDIFTLIFRSFIVICDFSGRNPNVFYEAGIAHTLGKHVIPITQSAYDIPFDLRHHRHINYLNNSEGRISLAETLSLRVSQLLL